MVRTPRDKCRSTMHDRVSSVRSTMPVDVEDAHASGRRPDRDRTAVGRQQYAQTVNGGPRQLGGPTGTAGGARRSERRPFDFRNSKYTRAASTGYQERFSPLAFSAPVLWQATFAPGHHTNVIIIDPVFNARRRLDPIAVYPAWKATQPWQPWLRPRWWRRAPAGQGLRAAR